MLIGSLVSSIKVSLVRFTRKRFTIYESNVSLEDRRADVSRDQRLFAFSVYTAYYRVLTATSISRNFLEGKSNSISTSRQLLRKVDRRVPVLSQRVNSYCSAVYISTFFLWDEWQICIFWLLLLTMLPMLRVSTTKNKVGQWIKITHLFVL